MCVCVQIYNVHLILAFIVGFLLISIPLLCAQDDDHEEADDDQDPGWYIGQELPLVNLNGKVEIRTTALF